MSGAGTTVELTEEQEEFLKQLEEEFADRFTEKDEEFQKVKAITEVKPPIIDPWYSRPPRNFDNRNRDRRPYRRDNGDRNRDFRRPRNYRDFGADRDYGHRSSDGRFRPY